MEIIFHPDSKEYFNALMVMIERRSVAEQDMFVDLINMLCSVRAPALLLV